MAPLPLTEKPFVMVKKMCNIKPFHFVYLWNPVDWSRFAGNIGIVINKAWNDKWNAMERLSRKSSNSVKQVERFMERFGTRQAFHGTSL